MIDWTGSYALRMRLYVVDPDTWADSDEVSHVTAARLDVATTKAELQTGKLDVTADAETRFIDTYCRLVAEVTQGGGTSREDIATLFCVGDSWTTERGVRRYSLDMSSVLYPASTIVVNDGTFLPAGVDAVDWAKDLLEPCIKAPVEKRGKFTSNKHIVFGGGASVLDVVSSVLAMGNFRMRIAADGTVTMCAYDDQPSVVITEAGRAFLRDGTKGSDNLKSIPNVVIAYQDGIKATATNNLKSSVTSIYSRGYERDQYESNPQLIDGETLIGYAQRRLEELSVLCEERTYSRDYIPDVFAGDLILAGIQQEGLEGDMRCTKQTIDCSGRITVQETAQTEVSTWQL